ncbi:MAG: dipeptide/oligopeptide/nickel ABC transporter permease/ATP-binding protein [Propionibacteriaceae bacterium]|jgi:oligopeptide/dipeptide ABC transporter ATP-binding protein|nr:dipeptide/oligopeptide/nickel ABC transporter permease/ATP-binding protein [Propionibacteriaceae bacterium]
MEADQTVPGRPLEADPALADSLSEPPQVDWEAPTDLAPTRRRLLAALRTPLGASAAILLGLVLLTALLAPLLWSGRAEAIDTSNLLAGPSAQHWIGTDALGRDLFCRVLVATRLSVLLALAATGLSVGVGLALGAAPVWLGPVAGQAVVWFIGAAVAFPGLLLALFFAVIFGASQTGAVCAIGLAGAPSFARLCHTLIAGVMGRDFVAAARVGGISRGRILFRHVLPNVAEPLVVQATMGAGGVLLSFAGLSFLGLGVKAPAYDWGRLMNEGLSGIFIHPLAALGPGLAVVLAGLAFNLTGEAAARSLGLAAQGGYVAGSLPARSARSGRTAARPPAPPPAPAQREILTVEGLRVFFPGPDGPLQPVRGVSFSVAAGQALGLVGESGSGKSLTALAVAQLIEAPGQVEAGRLSFCGADLLADGPRLWRHLLGTSMAMVFQDPMTSLNPTMRVGDQLAEVSRQHYGLGRRPAWRRAVERLAAVRIDQAERRARQYPHEFSGGMRQRAMIGMGVMGSPRLIIADEPTTALDVTVQEQVLDLLRSIRRQDQVAIWLISHDVAVVSEVCDRVMVMYAGRIVEELPVARLRHDARHPYTRLLVAAVPDMTTDLAAPLPTIPGRPVEVGQFPPGCAFAPRCPAAVPLCRRRDPELEPDGAGGRVACWRAGQPWPAVDWTEAAP